MYSTINSAALEGIDGVFVRVEADISNGMPSFYMVGYLASEVKEAKDRVRTALSNSGYPLPLKRITINLSPADVKKMGSAFDLPITAAVLAAMGVLNAENSRESFVAGEVSLSGEINPVNGILPMVLLAKEKGCRRCYIPAKNVKEGSAAGGMEIIGVGTLTEFIDAFNHPEERQVVSQKNQALHSYNNIEETGWKEEPYQVDFSEICGQEFAKRAAEVAVSGMHNFLMIGPPGAGKTMIAKRLPTILPALTLGEQLEISKIYSVAGLLDPEQALIKRRPFREPHHTITAAALIGGGRTPCAGEISLAHRGVLFLDELPEFDKHILEMLRQPLEERRIHITRLHKTVVFPAECMVVGALNPCNCGYYPDFSKCRCSDREVKRYLNKISQPFLERMDICVETPMIAYEELSGTKTAETSAEIRMRVAKAQQHQQERYQGTPFRFNSDLNVAGIRQYCPLGAEEQELMEQIFNRMNLSARSYYRIIKTARTVADLEGADRIETKHLSEAVYYRSIDKKFWGE